MTAALDLPQQHFSCRLETVFDACFVNHHTILRGGYEEPFYRAPAVGLQGVIQYRSDFFASALHEVSHWCIAGSARRQQDDYGYWYAPDGRDIEQQRAFESVEYKPQALEWFFASACRFPFKISVDNLGDSDGQLPDTRRFAQSVLLQVQLWQAAGLPERAARFFYALVAEFNPGLNHSVLCFNLEDLE
ncbi:MAG: elongation factor P hydroxylase [Halioglobus sp.]